MKKILNILILIAFAVGAMAQERTVYLNGGKAIDLNVSKWYAYNGNTSDRLIPTTRDTIDYIIEVKNQGSGPLHFYANFTFDTIAGADTTIAITVQGKKFSSEAYADIIASATTSAVSAETQVSKTTLSVTTTETETVASHTVTTTAYNVAGWDEITTDVDTMVVPTITNTEAAQTITKVANSTLYPRYIKFRLILKGNDSVGTGIKVKRLELQFYN